MVETDVLPISAVKDKGFKQLVQYLEPKYTISSRRTLTRRIKSILDHSFLQWSTKKFSPNAYP